MMVVSVKMKTIVFVVFLSMLSFSNAFAITGGLDYLLFLCNTELAETRAVITNVQTTPEGAETRLPLETYQIAARGPGRPGCVELRLGRIEYGVPIGGSASYTTTLEIFLTDDAAGETLCTFLYDITVRDQAFGPRSSVTKATANGVDSEEFEGFASNKRGQVFPYPTQGPTMQIYSRDSHVP